MAKGGGTKILSGGLLLLLILGLAGFGATNFGGTVRSVGSVGKTEIDINRYARSLSQELQAFEAQTGMDFTMDQARQFGIDQQVLDRLIAQAALEEEARRVGLSVGDEQVRDQIVGISAFAGGDGRFNAETYQFALQNAGLTTTEFEDSIRAELSRLLVQSAVLPGAPMPPAYTSTIMDWIGERRDVALLSLGPDDLDAPLPEPSPEDLRAYYQANPDDFTLPAAKNITYAWLSPEMVMNRDSIDEADLRDLYQARIDEYVTPERRLVERLVFASEDDAQAAKAAIDDGTQSFEDLVAARGLDLADVDLGDVSRDDLNGAADAVFALDEPGIAGPAPTALGPALFRVNAILPAAEVPFEDARPALEDEYLATAARRELQDRIEPIDDLLAGGATLEELAETEGMELGMIRWSPDRTDGIAAYQDFAEAASEVGENDYPEVRELDDGGLFALRLDAEAPPELQPFDKVRDAVVAAWEVQEITDRLTAQADAIVKALADGGDFDDLADAGRVIRVQDLQRTGFLDDTPDGLVEDLFDAAQGTPLVRSGVIEGDPQVTIAIVDAIKPATEDNADAARLRTQIASQANQSVANDLLSAFSAAVRADAGVTLNQAALNAVHSQMGN
ncbi:peptidyl-prolyl cis-trans isomerase [Aliiroseovarius sp. PTFE2010]|uniref:peptidyl-prolyl cis-trans isomerase n=1 Tax=Aliiroseovarius sp. PTFE2010 TaxID=3417190 RepID=UPI003CEFE4D4